MTEAWRYCENLNDPEAVKLPVQAVMTAHATIVHAQTRVDPDQFATALDWDAVRRECHAALQLIGHPAGK